MTDQNIVATAAALAEMIYARTDSDQAVTVADINQVTGSAILPDIITVGDILASGAILGTNNYYYGSNGFVGAIYQQGETYYVVLRGSDAGGSSESVELGWDLLTGTGELSGSDEVDRFDWNQNSVIGWADSLAAFEHTQVDDAMALARAALALAGGVTSKVAKSGSDSNLCAINRCIL